MRTFKKLSRDQLALAAVLIILVLLALISWLSDPSHLAPGKSRVDWPPVTPAKP